MEYGKKVKRSESSETAYAGKLGLTILQPLQDCSENEIELGFLPESEPGMVCYEIPQEDYVLLGEG
ncbi:MAG: hypothetical protein V7K97_09465 [Nostoc sp.]|uniref:hypothetical protein n=1 Tax=Nostoc sp. TaxID=1180 RepID=UPI002FFC39BD